jgi:hypothetical protein
MTFYQQDKHTCKVESSFLSPWIGNPRKQVQNAGGKAGERDVAYTLLRRLQGPKEEWEGRARGLFSQLGVHPL